VYRRADAPGKVWIRITVDGQRQSFGPWPDDAAGRAAADRERRRLVGADADGRLVRRVGVTFGQVAADWMAGLDLDVASGQISANTVSSYRHDLRIYVLPRLGHRLMSDITRADIKNLLATLLREGGRKGGPLSAKTVKNIISPLRRCLDAAVDDGIIGASPAAGVKAPRPPKPRIRTWEPAQIGAFLNALDEPWRTLFHLVAVTGMRRSEVLGLRWSEIDLDAGEVRITAALVTTSDNVTIFREATKTSSSRRTIPIDSDTVDALRRHRVRELEKRMALGEAWSGSDIDFAFTDEAGRHIKTDRATRMVERTASEIGLPTIGVHGLRHSLATNAIRSGVSPKLVADRLGHASVAITFDLYTHVTDADRATSAEMGRRMLGGGS
jgi:integrase